MHCEPDTECDRWPELSSPLGDRSNSTLGENGECFSNDGLLGSQVLQLGSALGARGELSKEEMRVSP